MWKRFVKTADLLYGYSLVYRALSEVYLIHGVPDKAGWFEGDAL
jgi:hypothetical protein